MTDNSSVASGTQFLASLLSWSNPTQVMNRMWKYKDPQIRSFNFDNRMTYFQFHKFKKSMSLKFFLGVDLFSMESADMAEALMFDNSIANYTAILELWNKLEWNSTFFEAHSLHADLVVQISNSLEYTSDIKGKKPIKLNNLSCYDYQGFVDPSGKVVYRDKEKKKDKDMDMDEHNQNDMNIDLNESESANREDQKDSNQVGPLQQAIQAKIDTGTNKSRDTDSADTGNNNVRTYYNKDKDKKYVDVQQMENDYILNYFDNLDRSEEFGFVSEFDFAPVYNHMQFFRNPDEKGYDLDFIYGMDRPLFRNNNYVGKLRRVVKEFVRLYKKIDRLTRSEQTELLLKTQMVYAAYMYIYSQYVRLDSYIVDSNASSFLIEVEKNSSFHQVLMDHVLGRVLQAACSFDTVVQYNEFSVLPIYDQLDFFSKLLNGFKAQANKAFTAWELLVGIILMLLIGSFYPVYVLRSFLKIKNPLKGDYQKLLFDGLLVIGPIAFWYMMVGVHIDLIFRLFSFRTFELPFLSLMSPVFKNRTEQIYYVAQRIKSNRSLPAWFYRFSVRTFWIPIVLSKYLVFVAIYVLFIYGFKWLIFNFMARYLPYNVNHMMSRIILGDNIPNTYSNLYEKDYVSIKQNYIRKNKNIRYKQKTPASRNEEMNVHDSVSDMRDTKYNTKTQRDYKEGGQLKASDSDMIKNTKSINIIPRHIHHNYMFARYRNKHQINRSSSTLSSNATDRFAQVLSKSQSKSQSKRMEYVNPRSKGSLRENNYEFMVPYYAMMWYDANPSMSGYTKDIFKFGIVNTSFYSLFSSGTNLDGFDGWYHGKKTFNKMTHNPMAEEAYFAKNNYMFLYPFFTGFYLEDLYAKYKNSLNKMLFNYYIHTYNRMMMYKHMGMATYKISDIIASLMSAFSWVNVTDYNEGLFRELNFNYFDLLGEYDDAKITTKQIKNSNKTLENNISIKPDNDKYKLIKVETFGETGN